mmetsp:Transcript_37640/g.62311  ORF Transcript_37640/g.62311 Transcript_37640/m.62311 type:complete len:197 (+) Transcript_37640:82-672(+)
MLMLDWLRGLFRSVLGRFIQRKSKMLFLGLDNAGKSTLLQMLALERLSSLPPTAMPHAQEIDAGPLRVTVFDCGGHAIARKVWRDYFAVADAIIFLVDAHDSKRFDEAKKELHELINCDELSHVPFLVLGNKIDLGRAASEHELRTALGLEVLVTGKSAHKQAECRAGQRPLELFMCSVVQRYGYGEGLRWLAQHV